MDETGLHWPAPAKLNLFLRVTGRYEDGYHKLQTLFQLLNWGDTVSITVNQSGRIDRQCNVEELPASQDIAVRAATLLKDHCQISSGANIFLHKQIPIGSGLGGGSSDAATTLVALNQLWSCGLNEQVLAELGLTLGADVPVFIRGLSAWAEGKGEQLRPVTLGQRHYVLVFPELSIATADVFGHADLKRDSSVKKLLPEMLKPGKNDCERVVMRMYPQLQKLKQDLKPWGQLHMSGTGSTFFLQFDTKKSAIRAASELKCRYNVRAVEGVDRSPLLDRLSIEI
jgi:4-diphosphocytidyl-2-C-methyl-D-erythritol kinase